MTMLCEEGEKFFDENISGALSPSLMFINREFHELWRFIESYNFKIFFVTELCKIYVKSSRKQLKKNFKQKLLLIASYLDTLLKLFGRREPH